MVEDEIEVEDFRASAVNEYDTLIEVIRTGVFVARHVFESAICWSLTIALCIVERYCRNLTATPNNQSSYWSEDDTNEEEGRQHCLWRENWLPSLQTLLFEGSIFDKS